MDGYHEFTILVDTKGSGMRLDTFAAIHIPNCSRTHAANLIRDGFITVQGSVKKPGYRVNPGEVISCIIPDPEPISYLPEPLQLHILFEDEDILVINKPAGMVVHPAPGHSSGTLVNGLLFYCPNLEGISGKIRPGIVHRLDKDTSGTLVIAKTALAMNCLSDQFKSRTIQKIYLGIVYGTLPSDQGIIELPIGRHPIDRKKMSTTSKKGRTAETHWKVVQRFANTTLIEISLKTGRTHQIRVHCAAIGHPIIGDSVYGNRTMHKYFQEKHITVPRQMLHAWKLSFIHPKSNKNMSFESSIPDDMSQMISLLQHL